ncbi:MAG: hypothetical protein H7257_09085 [Taibaiella sp.]|nr:hypothetical protein [Taibaiella sp.]
MARLHQLLKYSFVFFLLSIGTEIPQQVSAQENHSDNFGSNNLYYNHRYNEGSYTNTSYANLDFSHNDFYDLLAPYGQWIEDAKLGYVWSPDVDNDFRPYYTNGHWSLTDYGNTWISDYQWGWACFHYGRWTYDSYYGWLWLPGNNWGPAWVSWRKGSGYYCWAPLSPDYEVTTDATVLKEYHCPKDWWIYIPSQYIYSGNYYRYLYGPVGGSSKLKNTTTADNVYVNDEIRYVYGPTAKQVEQQSQKTVILYKLHNAGTPRASYTHNEVIKLFRPNEIKPAPVSGNRISPPNLITAPRPVTLKAEAVNINANAAPAFKNDLPGISRNTIRTVMPVRSSALETGSNWEDEHRADKSVYKTDIKTIEPERRGSANIVRQQKTTPPAQGTQRPEPVSIPLEKKNTQPPVNPEQHADPIPPLRPANNTTPAPAPQQHPEPITK